MSTIVNTFAILAVLVYLIYRRLLPKPLPGIPYDAKAAGRLSGSKPDMAAAYAKHGDFNSYHQELTHKLRSPLVQSFHAPGMGPTLYLSDPREQEDILLRRNKEFDRSDIITIVIGTIMPHSTIVKKTGPRHKAQRKPWADVMAPEFLRKVVVPGLYEAGLDLVALWKAKVASAGDGAEVDIMHDFDAAALDAIWLAILGEKLGGLQDCIASARDFEHDTTDARSPLSQGSWGSGLVMQKTLNFMNQVAFGWRTFTFPPLSVWLLKRGNEYRRFNDLKNKQIERIIRASIQRYQEAIASGDETPDRCAMDLVIRREVQAAHRAGVPLRDLARDVELRDEVFLLLWAGFDTTSNTLAWWTKYMARSPQTQDKLRAALREAHPGPGLPAVHEIIEADVPYLDGTIEEALRLAGTAAYLRQATMDTEILGMRVSKGTNIAFNSVVRQRPPPVPEELRSASSQAAYQRLGKPGIEGPAGDDLNEFVPERWLAEGKDGKMEFDPSALPRLAFGDGPRGCFGRRLAYHELKIMITLTTLKFEMLPLLGGHDNLRPVETMFRRPKDCFARFRVL